VKTLAALPLFTLFFTTAAPAAELPVLPDQPIAPVAYVPSTGNDSPRAATNGDTVFVVWRVFGTRLIEGACLRHDGEVLNVPSILIGRDANPNTSPIVLWIGGHYLVLWNDGSGKTLVRRFASDGSAIDPVSRPASISTRFVVGNGVDGMTVTNDAAGIVVQRIDADGQPLGSPVHASQVDDSEKTIFVVTQDLTRQTYLATAVAAEDGAIKWQRQLGLVCESEPVPLAEPGKRPLLLESTATAPTAPRVVFAAMLFSLPVPPRKLA